MTDLICRKSMTRCQTPGMCSPHGGCQPESISDGQHIDLGRFIDHVWAIKTERDQLRAEVAGLRTGYEAYERVNAELKAENEALRANSSLVVLLPELDSVLEDLEIHGQHSDQGYRKLKDWYRKVDLACKAIDAALGKGEQS